MKVLSLNVGEKKLVEWRGRTYATGIYKSSVAGPLFLNSEEVKNDVIIDKKNHGGIDKAVYAYSYEHYTFWRSLYPRMDMKYGFMGENLSVLKLEETLIHIGDIFELGETLVQVTKPRQPCFKLGIRFGDQSVIEQMWNSTKCGIYFRVLKTGNVATGDEFKLVEKALNSPSVAEVFRTKNN